AVGQSVLNDGCEAVLALPNLDVPRVLEHVDPGFARGGRRASAQSQSDLFLPVHQGRLLAGGGHLLSPGQSTRQDQRKPRQAEPRPGRDKKSLFSAFHGIPPRSSSIRYEDVRESAERTLFLPRFSA